MWRKKPSDKLLDRIPDRLRRMFFRGPRNRARMERRWVAAWERMHSVAEAFRTLRTLVSVLLLVVLLAATALGWRGCGP